MRRRIAMVARWLHIYLSMATFALVLFFSVTGLTLNHVEWFDGAQKTIELSGSMPVTLLQKPDELRVVEFIRNVHHIRGAVGDTRTDDQQYEVTFKGPGYSADAAIDRATGTYQIIETRNGFWAVMNDLHKGRDTGKAWGWVIDASAVLLVLVSLTGLALIFFLYKKRTAGIIVAAIGTVIFVTLYKLFVP
ncbi:MAG: PepSY-associated TM helix domain-containing protein [Acidobacteria bacterium]|nr:PepSY-associated TM helix domain-containing protein [Acidobacteriota bacterium]